MTPLNAFSLKIRKDGRGEWIPLAVRAIRPAAGGAAGDVLSDASVFETAEQAKEAKTCYMEEHPGIECRIFKTVRDEDGGIEEINVDALLEDRD